jgi:hypothetical protein
MTPSHCSTTAVPVGNLRSEILVVQSAQNWHRQRATDSLDGTWDRRIGNAVGTGTHTWLYVGETGDLSDRPLSHERKPCFDKNGANCLLIYSEKNRDMRLKIEADLRNAYNPPCNRSNAFSKKVENHACAVAPHAMYYNFVRIDQTLKVTPAMAAGE